MHLPVQCVPAKPCPDLPACLGGSGISASLLPPSMLLQASKGAYYAKANKGRGGGHETACTLASAWSLKSPCSWQQRGPPKLPRRQARRSGIQSTREHREVRRKLFGQPGARFTFLRGPNKSFFPPSLSPERGLRGSLLPLIADDIRVHVATACYSWPFQQRVRLRAQSCTAPGPFQEEERYRRVGGSLVINRA